MKQRIGIVGGGQLGRMLGIAAKQLGFSVTVVDPTQNSPAGQVVDHQIVASVNDEHAIRELSRRSDFLTFEVELANAKILEELAKQGVIVHPSAKTLAMIKDKFLQKQWLMAGKLPTTCSIAVETEADIQTAASIIGYPFLLKARHDAYDGRGNVLIKHKRDISLGLDRLAGRAVYVEQFVPYTKELAVMVVRSVTGDIKTYPVVETIHKHNICHVVIAPAQIEARIQKRAEHLATQVTRKLEGAGVFGIELFLTRDGTILINEIAPRVHNSGHYTIEACYTNQFEQHIRAITGLPLGVTDMRVPVAVMVNILGDRTGTAVVQGYEEALRIPTTSIHIYGKSETKPDRKMGHITAVDTSVEKAYKKAKQARKYISI